MAAFLWASPPEEREMESGLGGPFASSCPRGSQAGGAGAGGLTPLRPLLHGDAQSGSHTACEKLRSQVLLMPAALEMALLLLFWSLWTPLVSPTSGNSTSVWDSATPMDPGMSTSLELRTDIQVSTLAPSTPSRDSKMPSLGTSVGASTGPAVSEPMPSRENSTKKPSELLEISIATSGPAVPIAVTSQGHPTVTGEALTFTSLETSGGTSESSITKAASSLQTSSEASEFVPMATNSPETSSGPPVTKATRSVDTSTGASGTSVTMTTSSPEPSSRTSGHLVPMTVSSLVTSSVASSSPVSSIKVSMTTPKPSTRTSTEASGSPAQGRKGMLLVPVLVTMLVVIVIVALLLLWRQRQKRRTGILTLSGSGKRNGVVDAWAGPVQVPDEEAVTAAVGGPQDDKGSGVPQTEVSAQRPTLTTFFSRRKSRQGSLAMEELKSGPGPSLQGEEEPLVCSEDEAVEDPAPEDRTGRRLSACE
ncbi:Leukosialin [Fukomys damarensis]|uniref:Leukosialin n=1 Tax=Fukomys damarensis TaxID=885580 RepID=A0A091DZ07_FUKDA|nr:Leukosialin [Fukomys damarensis]